MVSSSDLTVERTWEKVFDAVEHVVSETAGEVYATETPGGEAAVAVRRGPYNRMDEAYKAIEEWMAANRRESAGHSWEIYGDPMPDTSESETTIVHLLK